MGVLMKNRLFWIFISVNFILTIADCLFTYICTPDLSCEGNLFVSQLKIGWIGLIAVNLIIFCLYVLAAYFTFIRYKEPKYKVNSLKEYISMALFNRPDKFKWIWYKTPQNWKPTVACTAYAILVCLPLARAIAVCEWCIILTNTPLTVSIGKLISVFPMGRVDLPVCVLAALVAAYYWFRLRYKKSLQEML
jgi:hypothetical protein